MAAKPLCKCHSKPMYWHKEKRTASGGYWRCNIKHIAQSCASQKQRYDSDPEFRDKQIQSARKYKQDHPERWNEYQKKRYHKVYGDMGRYERIGYELDKAAEHGR